MSYGFLHRRMDITVQVTLRWPVACATGPSRLPDGGIAARSCQHSRPDPRDEGRSGRGFTEVGKPLPTAVSRLIRIEGVVAV